MDRAAIVTQSLLSVGYYATLDSNAQEQPHPYLQLIHDNPDQYQPLREYGASRTRLNGKNGLQQNWTIHNTTTTIFSILIFRLVLFGSKCLTSPTILGTTQSLVFRSLRKYHEFVDLTALLCPFRDYASFICKQDHPLVHASWDPREMEVIWEAAISDVAADLSSTSGPITFSQGLSVVKSMLGKMNIPGTTQSTPYEAAVDLCYAGLFTFPTMDDIGQIIIANLPFIVNVFIWLDVLSPISANDADTVRQVFQDFYYSVETRLSRVEIARYDWNIVLAVHLLHCLPSFVTSLDTSV